jgi:putative Holliday junction resolvase
VPRVIALDPGTRRIGVAVSDSARTLAFPRDAVDAGDTAVAAIAALIAEEGATTVVVGRPISLAGRGTASTEVADRLFEALTGSVVGVEFVMVDERLSTVDASKKMTSAGRSARQQRADIDSAAAAVILQGFLDATPK